MFNIKEWIFNTLVADVKQNRLTRTQAAWFVNGYVTKGIFSATDVEAFAVATAEPETVEVQEDLDDYVETTE